MPIYESGEDYLEAILILERQSGAVRSIDLARHMSYSIAAELNYSKPSISRAMNILKDDGFITVESGGQIMLTEKGKAKAESIYERHVIITEFFEKVLGVDHEIAAHDACKIEHIISDESYQKLKEFTAEHKFHD